MVVLAEEDNGTGKLYCPALVADTLGRNSVQEVHDVEVLLLARLDGTEVARQWLAMASRAGGWRSME
jgi:hypothetical protein